MPPPLPFHAPANPPCLLPQRQMVGVPRITHHPVTAETTEMPRPCLLRATTATATCMVTLTPRTTTSAPRRCMTTTRRRPATSGTTRLTRPTAIAIMRGVVTGTVTVRVREIVRGSVRERENVQVANARGLGIVPRRGRAPTPRATDPLLRPVMARAGVASTGGAHRPDPPLTERTSECSPFFSGR